ncbi:MULTISPECIES: sulfurtransferase complex subunit TusB [unclassified Oleiphilus]|jgi:tRNA 2-thiouridine synthesizing protein B|uniref:sulfurtransferase complex subunit TusB n=1 Tax=unclassified Oleiphilus TaxID=2631174 RepID=UPI0007C341CF|nr:MULTISPECIES: sulfurtransferase complex subunit TusB [unclassified Oleiphilus]KZY45019.1 hypothetical protein A3732_11280 [Oleiphilus sp. HI0050]KZY72803.1 hypothetical protein A3740_20270 [Oleiphilus sp. HI0068]KZY78723.1 hypothetical protein A3741_08100 [Oleiphilus sp. HI0069]KZY87751.1 hypothetical protein A3743_13565 [Oleiphilus sp. HI0072]KZZ12018.1 hypothetical protein A3749_00810 [Oleiphilus sp. HI0078]KZZ25535.1 hypothetical protein A3752_04940 [Oleiphilus sp. HI0081]KZZ32058.1 hy
MTLHILNKPPSEVAVNQQLSDTILDGDCVVLIEDGVFQCLGTSSEASQWSCIAATIFVLTEDALARGVKIPVDYCKIDYNDLVELTIKHEKVHSWY